MLNKLEAKIYACNAIADLFGLEYFQQNYATAIEAYPTEIHDEVEFEYFLGFDDDEDDNDGKWNVFARVLVNRETRECTFLDYKTPDGVRMANPIKPTSFA